MTLQDTITNQQDCENGIGFLIQVSGVDKLPECKRDLRCDHWTDMRFDVDGKLYECSLVQFNAFLRTITERQ